MSRIPLCLSIDNTGFNNFVNTLGHLLSRRGDMRIPEVNPSTETLGTFGDSAILGLSDMRL